MQAQPNERLASMLAILCATCETTLEVLQAAEHQIGTELVRDLEKMVQRTRHELAAMSN